MNTMYNKNILPQTVDNQYFIAKNKNI